jgi:hypothetical protein
MKSIDLQFVKDTLLDLDPSLDGSETDEMYNTALVVLSAVSCGPDVTRLAAFTGLPEAFVAAIRPRMCCRVCSRSRTALAGELTRNGTSSVFTDRAAIATPFLPHFGQNARH